MSRNLRLSSDVELMAIMQRMRSPRSEMRDAESAHRVNAASRPSAAPGLPPSSQLAGAAAAPIYPLVGLCRAAGLPEPVPEYRFHPARKWRFDYAWPLHRVAVEIDGGLFVHGRHSRGAGQLADMEKGNAAALLGWFLLHYSPQQLPQAVGDLRIALARSA